MAQYDVAAAQFIERRTLNRVSANLFTGCIVDVHVLAIKFIEPAGAERAVHRLDLRMIIDHQCNRVACIQQGVR